MARCDECEALIDSDEDPACFGGNDDVVCKWCREQIADRRYDAMSDAEKDSYIGRHIVGAPPNPREPYVSSAESNNCEQDEGA